ncbi:hypothetical protein EVJ58_g2092 [Rhodofomes roseus]|uniref:PWWP domain-containing protein n=1 Tax=Rhodofomes roseus TaxID=34475 RepID=A0A4Y9YS48_9APHY|nr:hypothetical protein EVJ58_g2092 [Rhodofomes roseus]
MSKKGNKAQAKETKDTSYQFRDVVLAKIRGYPPWPGMGERPNAKSKKGTWFCVRFFPAGDYGWIVPRDISKLQPHEIQAYINEPYKKSADLLQGYRIALDPTEWEKEREAMPTARRRRATMTRRSPSLRPKKRKRDSEATPAKSKAKPKTPKKGSAEPATKKKAPSTKAKKNGHKSKALVESEDEGGAEAEDENAGPSKQASPPPTKKAKREKEGKESKEGKDGEEGEDSALAADPEASKVREWRHKLQKAFLNAKALPKDEDMPALDQLFSTVENYQNMSIQYLTFSKIGKVMRHINALPKDKVPRDDEFHFKDRAKTLVDKWHDILNENKPKPNGAAAAGESAKATTNGTSPAAKAPDAADAGATANGKEDKLMAEEASEGAMEVDDQEAKADTAPVDVKAESGDVDAEADAPADLAMDESVLADVTMSEAA